MDPYDKEKTRQIWKRVLGEEETPVCALDSAALRTWIAEKKTDACTYEALARQAPAGRELLRRLGREARCHARRLEAVYYLWTGEAAEAVSGPLPRQESLCAALRARHRAELESAQRFRRAAEELPEFRAAFLDLAAAAERNASALLCLMQRYV